MAFLVVIINIHVDMFKLNENIYTSIHSRNKKKNMKTEGIGACVVYNIRFINDKLVLREWELW